MGFKFDKRIDCKKCGKEMSQYKPMEGSYYKCTTCNNVIIDK